METNALLEMKRSNVVKALNRQEPDYVPNMIAASCATVAWTGQKVTDVLLDPNAYVKALTDVFDEMWCDGNIFMATLFTQRIAETFENVQNKFGPDGVTPVHLQSSPMKADEYDLFNNDFQGYIKNVLLPRMYPKLYSDREYAKKALKVYAEDNFYCFAQLTAMTTQMLESKYGISDVFTFADMWENPLDSMFDRFRGFRGTLTDLRRQPENVKKALETVWTQQIVPSIRPISGQMPYPCQMPHIPAYLSPKQFEELYWPYEKWQIERIAAAGGKTYIMLEGRWKNVWHHFLEVPKDSCILHVDDDDLLEAHALLGDHQILMGGIKMADVRANNLTKIKDDVKRAIDTCAPGGGFLLVTDKAWIAPGDVNQTLVEAYNFAHEYSKK